MRGKQARNRPVKADKVYNSEAVSKLINYIMQDGKKTVAEKIVYQAIERLGKELKMTPVDALQKSLSMVSPKVEVRSRRVGGANYQVPVPVSEKRQQTLSMRWITNGAREGRGKKEQWEALYIELLAATKKEGWAFKKKEDTHRMAEANKAFSHLTW